MKSFMFLGKKVPVGSIVTVHGNSEKWKEWGVPYSGPYPPKDKRKIELRDLKS